ncbi:prepilin-type N-terminal cleavage/methylation domain-containing protein [Glaciecola sp. MH2013]|nr:prepilin-type N-terminal cleavage/methylation domain-containing protein [Glaciecola sp. MH2013]
MNHKQEKRSSRRANHGFTLVELILVIVVLGILAVIVTPKFLSFTDDARQAQLIRLASDLKATSDLVYASSVINQNAEPGQDGTADIGTVTIRTNSGYPLANLNFAVKFLVNLDAITFTNANITCTDIWCGLGNQRTAPGGLTSTGLITKIFPEGYSYNDLCGVVYINDQDGSAPRIIVQSEGC